MSIKNDIERALGIKIVTPQERLTEQEQWRRIEQGKADWNTGKDAVISLRLASSSCKEIARAATTMFESSITGSPLADYVNTQYQGAVSDIYDIAYKACSNGKIILKPFVRDGEIHTKIIESDNYFPFKYDGMGNLIGVAFAETILRDDKYYRLLEKCTFDNGVYLIEYSARRSASEDSLGSQIALSDVPEWDGLPEYVKWPQVERPWFVEIALKDGRPVFADGIDLIREADKQMARVLWEFEGGELAIHADANMFKGNDRDGKTFLSKLNDRLYRMLPRSSNSEATPPPIDTFSPNLRIVELNHGLNLILRQYETIVGLPKAAFSDPQFQANTATEVKSAKPRFSDTVKNIQELLRVNMKQLIGIMADIAPRYGLAPMGTVNVDEAYFSFDQTTITTKEEEDEANTKEFGRLIQAVSLGLKPEIPIAFLYNTSDNLSKITPDDIDRARKLMGSTFELEE